MSSRRRISGTVSLSIRVRDHDVDLEDVSFNGWYEHDPGFWSYPNGDPGEPPSSDGEVYFDEDPSGLELDVLCWITSDGDEPVPDWWDEERPGIVDTVNERLNEVVFDGCVDDYLFDE